jgi:hypothetical protein
MGIAKPEQVRADGIRVLKELSGYQCRDGGFGCSPALLWPVVGLLTAYVLDVMRRAGALGAAVESSTVERALDFLSYNSRQARWKRSGGPPGGVACVRQKVLSEAGATARRGGRLVAVIDRMPVFALSYSADAMAARGERGPRYADVIRRITNGLRIDADRAHVEEVDDARLSGSGIRTSRHGGGARRHLRRKDDGTFVSPMVRWLLAARENGRWSTTQENVVASPRWSTITDVRIGDAGHDGVGLARRPAIGSAKFAGRSTTRNR